MFHSFDCILLRKVAVQYHSGAFGKGRLCGYSFVDIEKYPPMVIELKWNKNADAAIAQIKNKKYPNALQGYNKMSLVGISYNKDTKEHGCVIEEYMT